MNFCQQLAIVLLCVCFVFPLSIFADPVISVNPLEVESELNYGEVADYIINISNEGDEDLTFTIESELLVEPERDFGNRSIRKRSLNCSGPQRDDFGDVIAEYNLGQAPWSGLAWDGEFMYGVRYDSRVISIFNPTVGEIVAEVNIYGPNFGLAFQDPFFWSVRIREGSPTNLIKFNRNGDLLETLQMQRPLLQGIASDCEYLYYTTIDPRTNRTYLAQITCENEIIREIDCSNILHDDELSLEWVGTHDNGHLWAIEWNRGLLSQIDISGEEPELIQRLQIVRNQSHGITHDGENLWYTTMQGDWIVIDDGIGEITWLRYEIDDNVLEDGAETDLLMTLNTDDLVEGDYVAQVHVFSNDPNNPDVVVDVIMTVTGVAILDVSWSEEAGWPEVMDWRETYIDLFTDTRYPIPVTICNSGITELGIESILCENGVFTSELDNLILEPTEQVETNFIFNADAAGDYNNDMIIVWNSPDGENCEIQMNSSAANPPIIGVDPIELDYEFQDGEVDEAIIQISNEGGAALRFEIETVFVDEPEMLSANRRVRELTERQGVPFRDDIGDIIDRYYLDLDGSFISGLACVGDLLWIIKAWPDQIVCFNPETEEIVDSINVQADINCLSYDGQSFWAGGRGEHNGLIFQIDHDGNTIRTFDVAGRDVTGITFDGENLWYYSVEFRNENSIFRQISLDGELLREVDCTELISPNHISITWVPEHDTGKLWALSNFGMYQFNFECDPPEIFQYNNDNGGGIDIDHDGTDLWIACFSDSLKKIDDGILEHPWICLDIDEGEIEPESERDIVVSLGASGLIEGDYEAELHIMSNDPDNPEVIVNVLVHVNGNPVIDVQWSGAVGWPGMINWNLAYDFLYTGEPYIISVNISNIGTANLLVEEISSGNRSFRADQDDFVLNPGETREVNITLNAQENGRIESEMLILSNDRNNGGLRIPLVAEINRPPSIEIHQNAIESDLAIGESEEHLIMVSNNGQSELLFSVDHKFINVPDQDSFLRQNHRSIRGNSKGPSRDELGDVLAEYDTGIERITGIAYDGELIWCLKYSQSAMFSFDPEIGEIQDVIRLNGQYNGLDFDGEFFWVSDGGGRARIIRLDRNGRVLQTILADDPVSSISYDGENLWFAGYDFQGHRVIKQINTAGDLLREVSYRDLFDRNLVCLEWVSRHDNGQLWAMESRGSNLTQLDVSNDIAEIVQQTEVQQGWGYGLTHDGENIWCCNEDGLLIVIDDGIDEENWITYEPDAGEIDPEEELEIILTIDATNLEAIDYQAEIHIYSNDPDNADFVLNVMLRVEPNKVGSEDTTPLKYNLSSAYPNPFNSFTRIEYRIPQETDVSIKIYDIAGHLIQTLVNEEKAAGVHYAVWDGANWANGLYLIRFESEDHHAIRKVTLLK